MKSSLNILTPAELFTDRKVINAAALFLVLFGCTALAVPSREDLRAKCLVAHPHQARVASSGAGASAESPAALLFKSKIATELILQACMVNKVNALVKENSRAFCAEIDSQTKAEDCVFEYLVKLAVAPGQIWVADDVLNYFWNLNTASAVGGADIVALDRALHLFEAVDINKFYLAQISAVGVEEKKELERLRQEDEKVLAEKWPQKISVWADRLSLSKSNANSINGLAKRLALLKNKNLKYSRP